MSKYSIYAEMAKKSFTDSRVTWNAADIEAYAKNKNKILILHDAGFAIGQSVLDEAELHFICVDGAMRRQGLGQLILENFLNQVIQMRAKRVLIEVRVDNKSAINFYEKAKFQKIGIRKNYYRLDNGIKIDALFYERYLDY